MFHIIRLISLILILGFGAHTAEAVTFRLVTAPFKPFADPEDPRGGFLVNVTREALEQRGHNLEMTYRPWARAITEAAAGRYDGLLSTFYNEERGEIFYFSAPLNTTRMIFVALRDHIPFSAFNSLDQLLPYQIAIGRKWAYSQEFDEKEDLKKITVNDEQTGIRMLFSKRADLFAVNQDQFSYNINSMAEFSVSQVRILEPAIAVNDQHIAAAKEGENSLYFLSEFNTGLAALKASGRYQQIKNSYFSF